MSELPHAAYMTDPEQARSLDAALGERPYREQMMIAKSFGRTLLAEAIEMEANDASDKIMSSPFGSTGSVESSVYGGASIPVPEHEGDAEESVEARAPYLMNAPFMAHGALNTTGMSRKNTPSFFEGFQDVYTEDLNQAIAGKLNSGPLTPDALYKDFEQHGVAEIVTFRSYSKTPYGKFAPGAPKAGEGLVVLTYETSNSRGSKYTRSYTNFRGRPGGTLRYNVLLPSSDAADIKAKLIEDPAFIHEVTDYFMTERVGMPTENWQGYRPPYEKWRELDQGVSRLAVREHPSQAASQSLVITY